VVVIDPESANGAKPRRRPGKLTKALVTGRLTVPVANKAGRVTLDVG
jgi:hypothetical protein